MLYILLDTYIHTYIHMYVCYVCLDNIFTLLKSALTFKLFCQHHQQSCKQSLIRTTLTVNMASINDVCTMNRGNIEWKSNALRLETLAKRCMLTTFLHAGSATDAAMTSQFRGHEWEHVNHQTACVDVNME